MHWQATAHLEVNMQLLLVSGAQHAHWLTVTVVCGRFDTVFMHTTYTSRG